MIIIEGPDGGGKTTFIRKLAEITGYPIAPRVVTQRAEAMVDLKQWVEQNLAQGFQYTIYDRHRLISEPIYGSILRNRLEPGFDDLEWMTTQLSLFYGQVNPYIIYCIPSLDDVKYNIFNGEDDNTVVEAKVSNIYSAYVAKAAMDIASHSRVFTYNYKEIPDPTSFIQYLYQRVIKKGY